MLGHAGARPEHASAAVAAVLVHGRDQDADWMLTSLLYGAAGTTVA